MKSIISTVVFGFLLITSNAWASEADTSLDQEMANGLTVAQNLAAWDNSAIRYRMEPPVAPKNTKAKSESATAETPANEKS